jgi:hypothetical protein
MDKRVSFGPSCFFQILQASPPGFAASSGNGYFFCGIIHIAFSKFWIRPLILLPRQEPKFDPESLSFDFPGRDGLRAVPFFSCLPELEDTGQKSDSIELLFPILLVPVTAFLRVLLGRMVFFVMAVTVLPTFMMLTFMVLPTLVVFTLVTLASVVIFAFVVFTLMMFSFVMLTLMIFAFVMFSFVMLTLMIFAFVMFTLMVFSFMTLTCPDLSRTVRVPVID